MSLGFEQAGFDITVAVDMDAYHVTTHHRNFPYGKALRKSVADLTGEMVADWLKGSTCDLLFGGPPCQGFSSMGSRDAGDPRNSLVHHFVRVVSEVRPKAVVMENVPGMTTGATAKLFAHAVDELEAHGYLVTKPVRVLNARDFGVPQDRRRLFLLAIRADVSASPLEYPDGPVPGAPPRPTVLSAISDLPAVERHSALFTQDTAPYDSVPSEENLYARVARGLMHLAGDASRERIWNKQVASGCTRTRHSPKSVELYRSCAPGTMVPGHKLPKLDPNGLSPTLRAGTTSERGAFTAPRPIHPELPRVITAREAARLHGYPDWFSFFPKKWHAYRQIGNSVCPPVSRAIGEGVLRALGIDKDSLPRPSVTLLDEFRLPEDRPKSERRIPYKREFPKVINYLWENRLDSDHPSSVEPAITPAAIAEAIEATDAALPRVRPDRFLLEAKRFRGVRNLLSVPLASGYTILPDEENPGYGRWVRSGTLGALGESDSIKVSSAELNQARTISTPESVSDRHICLRALECEEVVRTASSGKWNCVRFTTDLLGQVVGKTVNAIQQENPDRIDVAMLFAARDGKLPKRSTIARRLADSHAEHGLLSAALTNEHCLVATFFASSGTAREIGRVVVRVPPHA